ncbi:MAG TPA: ABC transporter permease [Rhizomicrobium sp.]|nr:ABC transporter permease [Rhizomicrobium sp.]
MRALDRKLLRDLWHVRGQALAIAAVIACGVAIVVMTYGAMVSLRETREAYYERYRFADVFSQLRRAPLRVAAEAAQIPGVAAVEARITHYAALDIPGLERPAAALLVSIPDGGEPRLNRLALREGRLPIRGRDELVMSENMSKALGYGPGSKLSALLNGRKRSFTVVGVALSPEFVYTLPPGQLMADDKAFGVLWIDRAILEAAYDLDGAFNDLGVRLSPSASEPEVIRRLDALLARFGGTAAFGRADQISNAYVDQELDQLRTIAFVIPPVFLAVAAFLINMVLSRLIDTERESIGLLKAFGYSDGEVGRHYLKFSLAIAALGVLAGLGAGLWLGRWMTALYQDYFRFPFLEYRIDPAVFSAAIFISFAAAAAGTWTAARRAMRLEPAAAMQPPAPTIYRRALFDRLGLDRIVSMPTQMILRHIERWPLRAGLTVFGAATAVMLLVSLFFFFDSIDELIDSFYFRANRQDIVIGLVDQRGERAGFDIGRLAGVRVAEPVLEIPARLSHGHLAQRLGIFGVGQGAHFRAFYDSAGRSFTIPSRGIVLSNKLADLLGVGSGDSVDVEVLEGARRRARVGVAGIAVEHVGLSAYMDRSALAGLTGEPHTVTAVQALIDRAVEARLLKRLKDIPAVATISTRAQAISSLRDTMARSMTIVIDFYIGLGAIIAFGVVYNAARISLSERGRELASLRVLGFTQGEAIYILLGELALLVIAALPIGCALGYGLGLLMSRAMETKLFRVPFVILPSTYGIAMTIALASAAASALAVALRIRRLDLIAVLKTRE